jgi:hypothetical protein
MTLSRSNPDSARDGKHNADYGPHVIENDDTQRKLRRDRKA